MRTFSQAAVPHFIYIEAHCQSIVLFSHSIHYTKYKNIEIFEVALLIVYLIDARNEIRYPL